MVQIDLTADLRTASGEVQDIMVDGRYTGSLLLIYREGERLSSDLQLEQESIEEEVEADSLLIRYMLMFVRLQMRWRHPTMKFW